MRSAKAPASTMVRSMVSPPRATSSADKPLQSVPIHAESLQQEQTNSHTQHLAINPTITFGSGLPWIEPGHAALHGLDKVGPYLASGDDPVERTALQGPLHGV